MKHAFNATGRATTSAAYLSYPDEAQTPQEQEPTHVITLRTTVAPDAAVTTLNFTVMGERHSIVTASKREPGDVPDPDTGRLLAEARALRAAAARIERLARGRIRDAEERKTHRRDVRVKRIRHGHPATPCSAACARREGTRNGR